MFPIILKEHNSDYSEWYELEKENIIKYVGLKNIKRINHIGSSAVSGLISKPTVDILMEIDGNLDMEQFKIVLVNNGWILMSEENKRLVFNKGYTRAKSDFILKYTKLAREEFGNRYTLRK